MTGNEKINNGVLSLTHLARLKCIQNAHRINDIGAAPYHLVESVLKKKTAKSLKLIENKSSQIINDSEPLWKTLIERDFSDRPLNQFIIKNGKKISIPARDLYDKYFNERENQRKQAAENLKQITKNLNELKNKTKIKTLNHVIIPNNVSSTNSNNNNNNNNNNNIFKSTLLKKARMANKLRVKHFQQTNLINKPPKLKPQFNQNNKLNNITTIQASQLSYYGTKHTKIRSPTIAKQSPINSSVVSSTPVNKKSFKRKVDLSGINSSSSNKKFRPNKSLIDSTKNSNERLKKSDAYIYNNL